MTPKQKQAVKHYFSDYVTWLVVLTVLLLAAFFAIIALHGAGWYLWALAACFVLLHLTSLPWLGLAVKVWKDIRTNAVQTCVIRIAEIQPDRRLHFQNRCGGAAGKAKYILSDEAHRPFRLSASSETFCDFHSLPQAEIEITFLETSGLIVGMRIQEPQPATREEAQTVKRFQRIFKIYF